MNSTFRNSLLFGVLAIGACDSQSTTPLEDGQLLLPVPAAIRQIAALNSLPLEIQISVNNEVARVVPVGDPDEVVSAVINVPVEQNNEVSVGWFAIVGSQKVLLADFSTTVLAGESILNVDLYNSTGPQFDADGDGRSNLSEAKENRNLLSLYDLEVPLRTGFGGVTGTIRDGGTDTDISGEMIETDEDTTFSLRHDGSNLVVYVCGKDQTLHGDYLNPGDQYWHDDTVFIFIDGADSNSSSYDRVDDFQLAFLRNTSEMIVSKGGDGGNGQFCPNGTCVTFSFFNNSTACEYELTVNLPLAELNMAIGTPIGFDIELTDDDNGGKRETSSAWIGFGDQSNEDPGTFGTIILN